MKKEGLEMSEVDTLLEWSKLPVTRNLEMEGRDVLDLYQSQYDISPEERERLRETIMSFQDLPFQKERELVQKSKGAIGMFFNMLLFQICLGKLN